MANAIFETKMNPVIPNVNTNPGLLSTEGEKESHLRTLKNHFFSWL